MGHKALHSLVAEEFVSPTTKLLLNDATCIQESSCGSDVEVGNGKQGLSFVTIKGTVSGCGIILNNSEQDIKAKCGQLWNFPKDYHKLIMSEVFLQRVKVGHYFIPKAGGIKVSSTT